jgi:hypothetical protein
MGMIKMLETFRNTHINRRISPHPLRKALAITACAAAGLIALAVPAAATQAAAGAPTAVPPNQAPRSAVALAFDPVGAGFAFYRGVDNAVYMRTFTGTSRTWSAQSRIGGVIVGAPAAATGRITVIVAARGTNNALWLRWMKGGTWGKWTSWGGVLTSSPAISATVDGRIDVFVRGTDRAVWTRTLPAGGTLTRWRSLGGRVTTAPAVPNTLTEVYAAGTDHAVWVKFPGSAWKSLGGRTYSAPALGYIPQSNGGIVLVRGTDNALWENGVGGGGSTGWRKIGRTLIDAPTAAGTRVPNTYMMVGIIGTDHALWTATSPGWMTWSGFTRAWIPQG